MRRYTANTVWLSIFFAVVLTIVTVALTRSVLVWTNTRKHHRPCGYLHPHHLLGHPLHPAL